MLMRAAMLPCYSGAQNMRAMRDAAF